MSMKTVLMILIVAVVLLAIRNRAMAALNGHLEEHLHEEDAPA